MVEEFVRFDVEFVRLEVVLVAVMMGGNDARIPLVSEMFTP